MNDHAHVLRRLVLAGLAAAMAAGLHGHALAAAQESQAAPEPAAGPDCAAVDERDFKHVVACLSLEELAGQLTAFNQFIAQTLTGRTLEETVEAGVGTIMGAPLDPPWVHRLQRIAERSGQPPLLFFEDTERGARTILPSSLAQSFTWNLDLVERGARMAARESSAAGYAGILGPVADHSCTTRNGRSMETKGESPWLSARYVERIVRGFQGASLAEPDTVAATLKHWIGYQCAEDGSDYRGADVSRLELLETHAPPFAAGFRAGAAMFMPAFTQLSGVPMHMNAYANTRLRGLLDGAHAVSIGDHTGDRELIEHGVAGDACDAARKAFEGGLHITLQGGTYLACLPELVETGKVARGAVEERVIDVLRLKEGLGLYDDRYRYGRSEELEAIVVGAEHRAIARQLGREALVMLTRPEAMPLPLPKGRKILVTGPLAEDRQAMLGEWSARGRAEDVVTPCAGMARAFGEDEVACLPIEAVDAIRPAEIEAALRAASNADAIVVMLGETRWMSGEAAARLYPGIPAAQYRLVEALETLNKPLIAVVVAGRALPVSRLAGLIPGQTASADVVFYTSQLGIEAGNAIADVLSGAHAPSGRLSVSLPCESGIISTSFRERRIGRPQTTVSPRMAAFRESVGNSGKWVSHLQEVLHRDDCPIAFPFGHGLTYTDFAYADLALSAGELSGGDPEAFLEAAVTITNRGERAGVAVPQLYLRDTVAVPAPRRLELRGFERLELEPGASARVTFEIRPSDLATYAIDPETGGIDPGKGPSPQSDAFPVEAFVADGARISERTPRASFILTE